MHTIYVTRSIYTLITANNYTLPHTHLLHIYGLHILRTYTHNFTCTVSSHSTTHYHIVTYMTLYSHCTTVLLYIVTNYVPHTNYASSVDTHAQPQAQQCHHADSSVDQLWSHTLAFMVVHVSKHQQQLKESCVCNWWIYVPIKHLWLAVCSSSAAE